MKLAKDCPTHTHMRSVASDSRRGVERGFLGLLGLFVVHCNQLNNVAY